MALTEGTTDCRAASYVTVAADVGIDATARGIQDPRRKRAEVNRPSHTTVAATIYPAGLSAFG